VVEALSRRNPTDPAPCYWQASVVQLLIYDTGNKQLIDSFYSLSDRAVALARRRLSCDPDDAPAHFYLGMTELNRASLLGWQQRAIPAFRVLLRVTPHLRAALAIDSTLNDAWFGLGVVEYFKASADRYIGGLGLLGSRSKAYRLVAAVADSECLLRPAARFLHAYMLKQDGDIDGSVRRLGELLQQYPGNRTALRMIRDAQYQGGRLSDAVATGRCIEQAVLRDCPGSRYALAENWVVCGKAFAQARESDSARVKFARVVAWEYCKGDVPWLTHYVSEARRWLGKLRT
jgi:hypothetical protein